MEKKSVDSEHTRAIIFGASVYPRNPIWDRASFKRTAKAMLDYLRGSTGFSLLDKDLLNLFDDPGEPSQQLAAVETFLTTQSDQRTSQSVTNLIVYYVGHGCFSREKTHCFALSGTKAFPHGASCMRGGDFAEVIRHYSPCSRKFLFIDCCFAGALYSEFQSSPAQVFATQLDEEFPTRGTAMLCASSKDAPGMAPPHLTYTLFGGALLEALRNGHPMLQTRMSLRDVETLCRDLVKRSMPQDFTRPELLVPHSEFGDIANLAFFPNHAWLDARPSLQSLGQSATRVTANLPHSPAEAIALSFGLSPTPSSEEVLKGLATANMLDLYDRSTPEAKKIMRVHVYQLFEKMLQGPNKLDYDVSGICNEACFKALATPELLDYYVSLCAADKRIMEVQARVHAVELNLCRKLTASEMQDCEDIDGWFPAGHSTTFLEKKRKHRFF